MRVAAAQARAAAAQALAAAQAPGAAQPIPITPRIRTVLFRLPANIPPFLITPMRWPAQHVPSRSHAASTGGGAGVTAAGLVTLYRLRLVVGVIWNCLLNCQETL